MIIMFHPLQGRILPLNENHCPYDSWTNINKAPISFNSLVSRSNNGTVPVEKITVIHIYSEPTRKYIHKENMYSA